MALTIGGSKGGASVPPWRSKFFQFHAVFGKIWQNRMLAPPGELAPPPRGNPGSATVNIMLAQISRHGIMEFSGNHVERTRDFQALKITHLFQKYKHERKITFQTGS